ncbi:MAG: SAP domain-containing protein [Bacillaceae bacterium]|nr:SAP domain-containing protein [Bacillaceae bacterium]
MRLAEILPQMTKLFLSKTVDSFVKDVKFSDEEEMREMILKNIEEFKNEDRLKSRLNFLETDRDIALLNEICLLCLLDQEGYLLKESELFSKVEQYEKDIVKNSQDSDFVEQSIPESSQRIYTAVLKAAWNRDEDLNPHEVHILNVLRQELNLSKRDHYLLESIIGRFPQKGNKLHSHKQIDRSLKDLQSRGLVLRFKTDDVYYVIPEEISRTIRYSLGGELRNDAYQKMLSEFNVVDLKKVLNEFELITTGTKSELIERITKHNILPSSFLYVFSSSELTGFLRNLEGVKISGTKEEKIQNIIDYYEELMIATPSDPTDERAKYYDFFEELASRQYKKLRANKIIQKDIDVERYFELATQYIFEKKLGLELQIMKGSRHADGKINCGSNEVVLWDNKSTEEPYQFPQEHFDQFLGYIRSEAKRVTTFLVIASEFTNEAENQAQKLKAFSGEDTDVSLISAKDLKFLAEEWKNYSGQKKPVFNMNILDYTGVLTKQLLKDRMSWILK